MCGKKSRIFFNCYITCLARKCQMFFQFLHPRWAGVLVLLITSGSFLNRFKIRELSLFQWSLQHLKEPKGFEKEPVICPWRNVCWVWPFLTLCPCWAGFWPFKWPTVLGVFTNYLYPWKNPRFSWKNLNRTSSVIGGLFDSSSNFLVTMGICSWTCSLTLLRIVVMNLRTAWQPGGGGG